ncbi:MAG: hypothetical protein RJA70_2066 [Pseudomonadota bacterium]|jgi:hypothetical protein
MPLATRSTFTSGYVDVLCRQDARASYSAKTPPHSKTGHDAASEQEVAKPGDDGGETRCGHHYRGAISLTFELARGVHEREGGRGIGCNRVLQDNYLETHYAVVEEGFVGASEHQPPPRTSRQQLLGVACKPLSLASVGSP